MYIATFYDDSFFVISITSFQTEVIFVFKLNIILLYSITDEVMPTVWLLRWDLILASSSSDENG